MTACFHRTVKCIREAQTVQSMDGDGHPPATLSSQTRREASDATTKTQERYRIRRPTLIRRRLHVRHPVRDFACERRFATPDRTRLLFRLVIKCGSSATIEGLSCAEFASFASVSDGFGELPSDVAMVTMAVRCWIRVGCGKKHELKRSRGWAQHSWEIAPLP
jgi:hypothetical protein